MGDGPQLRLRFQRLDEAQCPIVGLVDHDASVNHHDDPSGCPTVGGCPLRIEGQGKDGHVECRRLADAGRQVDQSRPLPFGVHLGEQFVLPGEGRVAVNRLVVVDKVGGRQTEVRAAFVTAMSDVAAYVPGCLVSRRAHWVPPTGAQSP